MISQALEKIQYTAIPFCKICNLKDRKRFFLFRHLLVGQYCRMSTNGSGKFMRSGKSKIDGAGVGLADGFSERSRFILQLVEE